LQRRSQHGKWRECITQAPAAQPRGDGAEDPLNKYHLSVCILAAVFQQPELGEELVRKRNWKKTHLISFSYRTLDCDFTIHGRFSPERTALEEKYKTKQNNPQ